MLMVFARANDDLAFTRRALIDASVVAMKEKRYSSDGFQRGWKNWYDDAAKLFRKEHGWTPLAKARTMASEIEARTTRYLIKE